jgi:hypothetical protein
MCESAVGDVDEHDERVRSGHEMSAAYWRRPITQALCFVSGSQRKPALLRSLEHASIE